jgi:hypothetical protein
MRRRQRRRLVLTCYSGCQSRNWSRWHWCLSWGLRRRLRGRLTRVWRDGVGEWGEVQESDRFHDVSETTKDWAKRSDMEKAWTGLLLVRRGSGAVSETRVAGLLMLSRARGLRAVEATPPARLRSCTRRMVAYLQKRDANELEHNQEERGEEKCKKRGGRREREREREGGRERRLPPRSE